MFERCANLLQTTAAYKTFISLQILHLRVARKYRNFSASTFKKTTSSNNYYEILGLTAEATPQEIKTAYYTLCKQFHPDITDEKNFEKAAVNFLLIGEAYECLSNKESRAEYDKRLGIFGPMVNGDSGLRGRTQHDIERDLKAYAQFRREWRGKSAAGGTYGDQNQQPFYASFKKSGSANNGGNNGSPRYEYSEKDFENFYKTFKKRVSMDREYENAAARDPHLRHFRMQRSLHEHPAQKQAKHFYDNLENRDRRSYAVAMFFGVVVISLVSLRVFVS